MKVEAKEVSYLVEVLAYHVQYSDFKWYKCGTCIIKAGDYGSNLQPPTEH